MPKKKKAVKKAEENPALPAFGGFNSLAGGLEGFKQKLEAEKKSADNPQTLATAKSPSLATSRATPPSRSPEPVRPGSRDIDDTMSFHRMMSGVTPLAPSSKNRVSSRAEIEADAPRLNAVDMQARAATEALEALAHLHSIVDEVARFEVSDDGKRVEGRRADVSPELLRSLRRGLLPVDARLDLHGLTAPQAQDKLAEFLRAMRTRHERCVLVIHGKGEKIQGAGVLRGEIAAWLSQGKAREHVAAFSTARDDDGGEGAVYVALRR